MKNAGCLRSTSGRRTGTYPSRVPRAGSGTYLGPSCLAWEPSRVSQRGALILMLGTFLIAILLAVLLAFAGVPGWIVGPICALVVGAGIFVAVNTRPAA